MLSGTVGDAYPYTAKKAFTSPVTIIKSPCTAGDKPPALRDFSSDCVNRNHHQN